MYSAFLFEAKNRKKEIYSLVIVLDQNMRPVICVRHGSEHDKVLKKWGYDIKKIKIPFGVINIPVSELRKLYKETIKKMGGVLWVGTKTL